MLIQKEKKVTALTINLIGRLDTNTAPELENSLEADLDGINELYLNLKELDYISSAGLRIILKYHKHFKSNGGKFIILNPKDEVLEVFDMTGFSTFLEIKE